MKRYYPSGCCVRCYYAKKIECACKCGGAYHGLGVAENPLTKYVEEAKKKIKEAQK